MKEFPAARSTLSPIGGVCRRIGGGAERRVSPKCHLAPPPADERVSGGHGNGVTHSRTAAGSGEGPDRLCHPKLRCPSPGARKSFRRPVWQCHPDYPCRRIGGGAAPLLSPRIEVSLPRQMKEFPVARRWLSPKKHVSPDRGRGRPPIVTHN